MSTFNTLEEAQAEILRLNEKLTETETERDTLSSDNKKLTEDLSRVRTLNQTYFEKLSSQYAKPENENNNDEEEVLSCEAFALTINI